MVPDGAALRAAARTLDEQAGSFEAARVLVRSGCLTTLWDCRAGAEQRAGLSELDAAARTGCDELRAGATSLRRLAEAADELDRTMSRAWSSAQRDLQAGLRSAAADPARAEEAAGLRRRLASLPASGEAHWARQVGAPRVALVSTPATLTGEWWGPVPRVGVVRVDVAALRDLALTLDQQGGVASASRTAAASAVALPLHQLDEHGLPGTRVGGLLADATSPTGAVGRVSEGWVDAAARARALADLVAIAGDGDVGAMLDDPLSAAALRVAVMLRSARPYDALDVLDGLSEADAQWVLSHVPGDAVDDEYVGISGPAGVLTAADVLAAAGGGVMAHNADVLHGTAALGRSQAAVDLSRALASDPAHVGSSAAWYRRVDEARIAGSAADDLARRADDLGARGRAVPVKLAGGLAVLGIAYDIHSGKDPTQAVVSGAAGFAASVAVGAAIGTAIPVPVVGTVVGALVGAGVGIFTSGMVDSVFEDGPDVGAAVDRGIEALTDTGEAVVGAPAAIAGAFGGWLR